MEAQGSSSRPRQGGRVTSWHRASTHSWAGHLPPQSKTKVLGLNEGKVQSPFLCRKLVLSGCWSAWGEEWGWGSIGGSSRSGVFLPGQAEPLQGQVS